MSTSVSFIRLQAGLMRETITLPDSVELGANGDASSDQILFTLIRDAADSFVNRRVSSSADGKPRRRG